MRFLIDSNRSPLLAGGLKAAGHDAVHVRDHGLQATAPQSSGDYPQTAEEGKGVGPGLGGLVTIMAVLMATYCQPG